MSPRVKTQLTMLRFNGLVNRIGGQQMRANLFWFSDGQWARIEPFIPSNRRGVKPKNNRRILSGIMHVLKSGCRWVDCPPEYGPAKTVYIQPLECAGNLAEHLRGGGRTC